MGSPRAAALLSPAPQLTWMRREPAGRRGVGGWVGKNEVGKRQEGVLRRPGRGKCRGAGSPSRAPLPTRSRAVRGCRGLALGIVPVPQAAPASPSRPRRSPGRRHGARCEVPPLRLGGTRSGHLRGSRSGLPQRPLSVRSGASAPRMLVPPPFGKAAPWPASAPPAAAAGCCSPSSNPLPLCVRYRLRASPGRSSRTRTALQGPRPRRRTAPRQCETGLRGPSLSVLQAVRRPAAAPEPPPNTAATTATPGSAPAPRQP